MAQVILASSEERVCEKLESLLWNKAWRFVTSLFFFKPHQSPSWQPAINVA